MNERKLLLNERVEVRQFEEGLRGSWHPGVVVGVSNLCRSVEYDELLDETGRSKLIESIPVTQAIEGLHRRRHVPSTYRGHIRPLPPSSQCDSCQKLHFGICVDALFEDAWWEGVVLDCDDSAKEWSVFFPDEGDERKFSVTHLRVTRDWDEFLGIWRDRGVWILVQLARELEGDVPLSNFIKKVWFSLRLNYGFMKMISEWTSGARAVWSTYFIGAVCDIAVESRWHCPANHKVLTCMVGKRGNKSNGFQKSKLNLHLSGGTTQLRSCNGFKIMRSSKKREEEKAPLGKCTRPKSEMQSQKSKLNSHSSGSAAQLRSSRGFIITRSRQKREEENAHLGKCSLKRPSPKSELKFEEHPVIDAADEISFQADKSCKEKKMTVGASLMKSNAVVQGECDRISSYCSSLNEAVNCVSLPMIRKQSGKVEGEADKLKSLTIRRGEGNQLPIDSSSKEKIMTHDVSHVQKNESIRKRNLTRLKKYNTDLAVVYPKRNRKQVNRKAPHDIVYKQKKCSVRRKRVSKKSQRANLKTKLPSKIEEKGVDAVPAKYDIFANLRRGSVPFGNIGRNIRLKDMVSHTRKRKVKRGHHGCQRSDTICSFCHYGGDVIHCGRCMSSYHLSCVDLKDVSGGKWFCPSCCCGLCGLRDYSSDNQQFTNVCLQCTREYHVACLSKAGCLSPTDYTSEFFCSEACYKLCTRLHQLLGIPNPTVMDGLTWTLMRSFKNDCHLPGISRINTRIKLSHVLRVIHECFEPVMEPHTKRDLVRDVVFSSASRLKRLNFRGFYAAVLHKGDEILSVATVRIHGLKAAEMPLVATPFRHRRQGMCRLLVNELEKLLIHMGIERLILPSVHDLKKTWETCFGFSRMALSERRELLGYPLLGFQGTMMLQKFLGSLMITKEKRDFSGTSQDSSGIPSCVFQEHKVDSDDKSRFCGFVYKRKMKTKNIGKENMVNSCNGSIQTYEYVYKRRRILTSTS